jgi:hypothetical protein
VPSYMIPNAGGKGGAAGSQPMSTAVHRSPNNFEDLTPYLTYVCRLPAWCAQAAPLPRSQAEQQMQNSAKVKQKHYFCYFPLGLLW